MIGASAGPVAEAGHASAAVTRLTYSALLGLPQSMLFEQSNSTVTLRSSSSMKSLSRWLLEGKG